MSTTLRKATTNYGLTFIYDDNLLSCLDKRKSEAADSVLSVLSSPAAPVCELANESCDIGNARIGCVKHLSRPARGARIQPNKAELAQGRDRGGEPIHFEPDDGPLDEPERRT